MTLIYNTGIINKLNKYKYIKYISIYYRINNMNDLVNLKSIGALLLNALFVISAYGKIVGLTEL